jgi:hypothetical protein
MLNLYMTKRYAAIDTETQDGGRGSHQSLTWKSNSNFILQSEHYKELYKHSGTIPVMVYMFQMVYTTFFL